MSVSPVTSVVIVLSVLLTTGCGGTGVVEEVPPQLRADPGAKASLNVRARVVHVVDGDTVVVQAGRYRMTVRLIGIDTPETVKPGTPVQCFGPEATARARALMPTGRWLVVETDPNGDRVDMYGRLLGYVTTDGQSLSVNEVLLREGFADLYVFRQGPPFHRVAVFRQARDTARDAGVGLWSACPRDAR